MWMVLEIFHSSNPICTALPAAAVAAAAIAMAIEFIQSHSTIQF